MAMLDFLRAEVLTGVVTGYKFPANRYLFTNIFGPSVMGLRKEISGDVAKWDQVAPLKDIDVNFEGREKPSTPLALQTVKSHTAGMLVRAKHRRFAYEQFFGQRGVGDSVAVVASAERQLAFWMQDFTRLVKTDIWELMLSQMLTTGGLAVNVDGVALTVTFGLDVGHTTAPSNKWDVVGTDIMGYVETWRRLVSKDTGLAVTRAYIGRDVKMMLRKNTELKSWFQANNGAPQKLKDLQADVIVDLIGLDWITHQGIYGAAGTPFLEDDRVVLTPDASQDWVQAQVGKVAYPTNSMNAGETPNFNETYDSAVYCEVEGDPPSFKIIHRWAGMPVLPFPNAIYTARVGT